MNVTLEGTCIPTTILVVDCKDITHINHFSPETFTHSKFKLKGKIWITIPIFHKLRFNKRLFYLNSIINNMFTGVEGILQK